MAREKLTKKEIGYIQRMAATGIPKDDIVTILKLRKRNLEFLQKVDGALCDAIELGKAQMGADLRQRLWQKVREGDMRAIEFACKTQLGMRTQDRLELTGPNGGPIQTKTTLVEPTREEIEREVIEISERLSLVGSGNAS